MLSQIYFLADELLLLVLGGGFFPYFSLFKEKDDFLSWSLVYLLPFGCVFLYVRYFSLTHTFSIYSMHLDLELTTDI